MKASPPLPRWIPAAAALFAVAQASEVFAEGETFVGGVDDTQIILELPCDDDGQALPEVRGIMVCLHTGDVDCGRVARTLGFAWLTDLSDNRPEHIFEDSFWGIEMLHSIALAADELGHPELRHAPLAWTGFSDGGGAGLAFAATIPGNGTLGAQTGPTADRMLAIAHNDGSTNVFGPWQVGDPGIDEPLPPEMLGVPVFFAERENAPYQLDFFDDNRADGARWGRAAIHTRTEHSDSGEAWPVAFYFLQEVIKGRYPTDAAPQSYPDDQLWRSSVPLLAVDEGLGWVVGDTNEVTVQPIEAFDANNPEHRAMSWMPTENLAYAFRAVASWNRLGPIERLGPEFDVVAPGDPWQATINIDARWSDWETLDVYDGAQLRASFRPGSRLTFTFTPTEEDIGVHLFNVVAQRGSEIAVSPPSGLLVEGIAAFPWEPFPGGGDDGGDGGSDDGTGDDGADDGPLDGGGTGGGGDEDDANGDGGADASVGSTGGVATGDGGGDGTDGSSGAGSSGCRVVGEPGPHAAWLGWLAWAAVVVRRRRPR